jgi:hypothetical protein
MDRFVRNARIIGVEYLQNFPVLLGLMAALSGQDWPLRLLWIAVGAFGTAAAIALTERIKLGKQTSERPIDLLANAGGFFVGMVIYLLYFFVLRTPVDSPWVALGVDVLAGGVLGALIGLVQALFVDERRLNRAALAHTAGLALAGGIVLALLGALAGRWSPILAAAFICAPMTLSDPKRLGG